MNSKLSNNVCFDVDAHGTTNILGEAGWTNIRIVNDSVRNQRRQIQGISLNCILRGMFILYGHEIIYENTLPGGYFAWEEYLEPFFISMTHLCSIDDVLRRIQVLLFLYLEGNRPTQQHIDPQSSVSNVLYGAFSFLLYWVLSFNAYLTDVDLSRLKHGINRLGDQLNSSELDHVRTRMNTYSYYDVDELERLRIRFGELQAITNEVVQNRLLNTIGLMQKNVISKVSSKSKNNNDNKKGNAGGFLDLGNTGQDSSTAFAGSKMSILHHEHLQPNVVQVKGNWGGFDAAVKKQELKQHLAKAPPVKLEIFGGDTLFDSDSDDSDDQPASRSGGKISISSYNSDRNAVVTAPVVRIPPGFSLLKDPLSLVQDIFDIDALELARQWTLIDHALFCAIPLHSLLAPPETSTTVHTMLRHQQTRIGILGGGVFQGARGFIDRFCALSAWITQSILSVASVDGRASRVSFFIRLAGHMSDLANFNGLMAVLTALQQAAVTRLKATFELVSKQDKSKLENLQVSFSRFF
jgi:hypothetical protein